MIFLKLITCMSDFDFLDMLCPALCIVFYFFREKNWAIWMPSRVFSQVIQLLHTAVQSRNKDILRWLDELKSARIRASLKCKVESNVFLGYNRLSRIDSFHSNARNTWDDDDPSFFSQKDSFMEFCPILLDLKFKKKD